MKTNSYSELRRNLAGTIDRVNADREQVIITRDVGKPAAVPMSPEDYASFEETRYLLASPKNAERLREAIAELDKGEGRERALEEPDPAELSWFSTSPRGKALFIGKRRKPSCWRGSIASSRNARERPSRGPSSRSPCVARCRAGGRGG